MTQRRGVILPAVLFILVLVALMSAMFAFRVNADLASQQAIAYRFQTRLAAEAGIERVRMLLRDHRYEFQSWYNNPEELNRIVVWGEAEDDTTIGTNKEFDQDNLMTYRFSIVADDPTDDEDFVRFGITDESSKLNLNVANAEQLLALVTAAANGDDQIVPLQIVDAILDWRDADSDPRGEADDTEGLYYSQLPTPYKVKNGPFDTVEELLLVKGMTGRLLYGEDYNQNGILDPNERDGDYTFPDDNQDDFLNQGMYPYLTVRSYETNVSNDNRPRTYLFGPEDDLRAALEDAFPGETELIDFVISAARANSANAAPAPPANNTENAGQDNSQDAENAGDGDANTENSQDQQGQGDQQPQEGETGGQDTGSNGGESNGEQNANRPIRSPATLLFSRQIGSLLSESPVKAEQLPVLMDRFTVVPPSQKKVVGLIDVNTAPRQVLLLVPGLKADQVDAILEARQHLTDEERLTTAWLVTNGVLDNETYDDVAPLITARGQQFTVESLGYADHIGMVTRLEVVLDMVGPIPQTVHYRDMTRIGGHFPIRKEDLQHVRVR